MRWLAVSAALMQITQIAQSIAIAVDQSRRLILTAAVTLIALIGVVALGLPHGPNGVALAVAVANLVLFLPRLWWRLQGSPVRVAHFASALKGPFTTAFLLGIGAAAGRAFCPTDHFLLRLVFAFAGGMLPLGVAALSSGKLRDEWRVLWTHLPWAAKTPPISTARQSDAP
jgi:O-antigen/teichoic acid export membrane protein